MRRMQRDMNVSVRFPAAGALDSDDPRVTVTINEQGTPWPLRFHFLRLTEEVTNELSLVNVGFEFGDRFEGQINARFEEDPEAIDLVSLKRIVGDYASYLQLARLHIGFEPKGVKLA